MKRGRVPIAIAVAGLLARLLVHYLSTWLSGIELDPPFLKFLVVYVTIGTLTYLIIGTNWPRATKWFVILLGSIGFGALADLSLVVGSALLTTSEYLWSCATWLFAGCLACLVGISVELRTQRLHKASE